MELCHPASQHPTAVSRKSLVATFITLRLPSGDVGRHGIAIMAMREGLSFETTIESDCAPLWKPVAALLEAGVEIHCLRDLRAVLQHSIASGALRIGQVLEKPRGMVTMKSRLGTERVLDMLSGEQLPRICWPSLRLYAPTSFSRTDLLRIVSVEPLRTAIWRLRKSASTRVTVSREVPIIWAISS